MVAAPPRWTYAVGGSRLRVSAGLLAWVPLAALALALRPGHSLPLVGTPLALVACLVVSMLVHEGAHAWAARRLGYRVQWVVLGGLAGVTAYLGRDDRPLERAAVALAGPAASAVAAVVLVAVRTSLPAGAAATDLVEAAIVVNVLGLVVNLVPVGGSDGARAVRGLRQHSRARRGR